jgi:hypothetical protein
MEDYGNVLISLPRIRRCLTDAARRPAISCDGSNCLSGQYVVYHALARAAIKAPPQFRFGDQHCMDRDVQRRQAKQD